MTIRFSEGAVKSLLGDGATDKSLAEIFVGGALYGYAGVQPDSANDSTAGYTLLAIASKDGATFVPGDLVTGNGIEWGAPTIDNDNYLAYLPIDAAFNLIFKGVSGANGNMGWCRLVANPVDDGSQSFTLPRIDFSVGTTSGDVLLFPSTKIVENGLYPAVMKRIGLNMQGS